MTFLITCDRYDVDISRVPVKFCSTVVLAMVPVGAVADVNGPLGDDD